MPVIYDARLQRASGLLSRPEIASEAKPVLSLTQVRLCSGQEVMDNLMISQLEFRAEEDADVAAHTFKKHVTAQARDAGRRSGSSRALLPGAADVGPLL